LTPKAVEQLRNLFESPESKLIRIGVKNRGCSGLAYHLEYVDKPATFDETVEQDGVKVLIDSKALFSIIGSEMDWLEDKLSARFIFRNPNISMCLSTPTL
jgi:iron-sulfur cluster assembly protein